MSNINENSNLLLSEDPVDINLPIQTNNPLSINEKQQPDKEENMMTLSSSCIEQEILEKNRKRKFDELDDKMMKQQQQEDDEEKRRSALYENISDHDIKERLCKTMTYDVHLRLKIRQWLETDQTLLLFIRQHATLLAKYYSFKMKLELYQNYIHMTESVFSWLSGMTKTLLRRNNINDQFFKIQKYINKQLKNSEEEFSNITEKLAKSISDQQYASKSTAAVDMKLLTSLIVMLVREDQQRFNVEFIKKRHLLMLNAKDVRLVHEFYHLQPDSQQLQIAEQIWQATIDEQRTKNVIQSNPQNKVKMTDYGLQIDIQKKSFLTLNNQEEGKDLLSINYLKLNTDLLMNIIESRQKILRQRLEFEHDFKQTFFVDDDNDNDSEENDENNDGHNNNKNRDKQ